MFTFLPHDILLRCIAEYLEKDAQYQLFALCSAWKPLLYQCRTIDLYRGIDKRCSSHNFYSFIESLAHRRKVLRACGIDLDNETSVVPSLRPLRVNIFCEQHLHDNTEFLFTYLPYIGYIKCMFNSWFEPPFLLDQPTPDSVARLLQSRWYRGVHSLHKMWNLLVQHDTQPEVSVVAITNYQTIASSLRGVHCCKLGYDGTLFVELHPTNREAKLQMVVLHGCRDVLDMASLYNIPTVVIKECDVNNDVSALANADTIALYNVEITDLRMLGNVRKLTLNDCQDVRKYPIPTLGQKQKWKLFYMNIRDLSTMAYLDTLEIIYCAKVSDLSMLGHVRKLEFVGMENNSKTMLFPTPLGKGQDWTFRYVTNIDCEGFHGLHRLTLIQCNNVKLSNTVDITNLALDKCTLQSHRIHHFHVHAFTLTNNILIFADDVHIVHLKLHYIPNYTMVVFFFLDDVKHSLQSLQVGLGPNNRLLPDFVHHEIVRFKLLLYDVNQDAVRCLTERAVKYLTNEPFTNCTIRSAGLLWCTDADMGKLVYGDIHTWDVSQVTDMNHLFYQQHHFNDNISTWDVSKVKNMDKMFYEATAFNQPLHTWNMANVLFKQKMFHGATAFHQPSCPWSVDC